jgi:hypothetical protein
MWHHALLFRHHADVNVKTPIMFSTSIIILKVLLRWTDIIPVISQIWKGHWHFYCESSMVSKKQGMVPHHARIGLGVRVMVFNATFNNILVYGSWIFNHLCNQCLTPLTWVWIPFKWGVLDTTLCDKVKTIECTVKFVLRGHLWNKEKLNQYIWKFLWQDKKKVTFWYIWLLNRGDRMGSFDCTYFACWLSTYI